MKTMTFMNWILMNRIVKPNMDFLKKETELLMVKKGIYV